MEIADLFYMYNIYTYWIVGVRQDARVNDGSNSDFRVMKVVVANHS